MRLKIRVAMLAGLLIGSAMLSGCQMLIDDFWERCSEANGGCH